ncbi:MAG: hypothetical protein F2817_18725 [Actinobacteria bacterium]|nr:hypothetical protein [Actinomycetota bacterium]
MRHVPLRDVDAGPACTLQEPLAAAQAVHRLATDTLVLAESLTGRLATGERAGDAESADFVVAAERLDHEVLAFLGRSSSDAAGRRRTRRSRPFAG